MESRLRLCQVAAVKLLTEGAEQAMQQRLLQAMGNGQEAMQQRLEVLPTELQRLLATDVGGPHAARGSPAPSATTTMVPREEGRGACVVCKY